MDFTLRIITGVFLLLLVFICFYKQFKKAYKSVRNEIRAKKLEQEFSEV